MQDEKLALIIVLAEDFGQGVGFRSEFHHVDGFVRAIRENGSIINLSGQHAPLKHLDSLRLHNQNSERNAKDGGISYAWSLGYREVYEVDASRAEGMAKTLRAVEKKLAKLHAKQGEPKTYDEFVLQNAAALGIDKFAVYARQPSQHNFTDSGDYDVLTPTEAAAWIAERETAYIAKFQPEAMRA